MLENIPTGVMEAQVVPFLKILTKNWGFRCYLCALVKPENRNIIPNIRKNLLKHNIALSVVTNHGMFNPATYINILGMMFKILFLVLLGNIKYLIGREFPPFMLLIPLKFMIPFGFKSILDLRGVYIEELVLRGNIKAMGWLFNLLKVLEKITFLHADYILSVSNNLASYVNNRTQNKSKTYVIPCCITQVVFNTIDKSHIEQLRNQFNLKDKFVVVYAGSISAWNLPTPMLKIFKTIKEIQENAHFLFLTPHIEEAQVFLFEIAKEDYTLLNVPYQDVCNYISLGDVGLLLREKNIVNQVASPIKFAEYLACGVPVIVSKDVGDYSDVVVQKNVGFVVNIQDTTALDGNLLEVVNSIVRNRAELRKRCILVSKKNYCREYYLDVYRKIFT